MKKFISLLLALALCLPVFALAEPVLDVDAEGWYFLVLDPEYSVEDKTVDDLMALFAKYYPDGHTVRLDAANVLTVTPDDYYGVRSEGIIRDEGGIARYYMPSVSGALTVLGGQMYGLYPFEQVGFSLSGDVLTLDYNGTKVTGQVVSLAEGVLEWHGTGAGLTDEMATWLLFVDGAVMQ